MTTGFFCCKRVNRRKNDCRISFISHDLASAYTLPIPQNLENLLILGKTGLGKTHLAIALGKRLCQEGHATQFLPVNFLFEEIQAAKAAGRYLNYVRSLIKAKVLILDDLGLRNYSHEEATSLMDILEERYHMSSFFSMRQNRRMN